jgi:hypothetical protein
VLLGAAHDVICPEGKQPSSGDCLHSVSLFYLFDYLLATLLSASTGCYAALRALLGWPHPRTLTRCCSTFGHTRCRRGCAANGGAAFMEYQVVYRIYSATTTTTATAHRGSGKACCCVAGPCSAGARRAGLQPLCRVLGMQYSAQPARSSIVARGAEPI